MSEHKIPIPSRLYNAAIGGHVTGADQIIDDKTGLTLDKFAGGALEEKTYISDSNNGMGRVVLRKNLVNEVNTLVQTMINKSNTIYVIQYDYTLGENITIPANCVLEFNGGSISGAYTITGNNTCIKAESVKIFSTDTDIIGSWNIIEAYPEWFGAIGDGITDDTIALSKTLCYFRNIKFNKKTYLISDYIKIYSNTHINGYGEASKIKTVDGEYGGFRGYNNDNINLPLGDCLIENIALIYTKSYVGRVFDCPIAFYFILAKNMTFKNIYFENAPLECIGGTNCDNFLIDGCRVHNCADGAFTFVTGKNYKIVNNYVLQDTCLESKNNTSMGGFVDLGASLTNFAIEGNIVIGGTCAIYIRDEVSNGTINGNVFCDQHGNSIALIFEHNERQYDFVVDNVTISNNVFKQSRNTEDIEGDKAAISCIGCHNMIINGNTFKGTYLYGVYISGDNTSICVSDNMIIDIVKAIHSGADNSTYINISRNTIKNFEVGIYINSVESYVRNNILYSNISDCIGINVPQYYTRNTVEYNVVNAVTPLSYAGDYIVGDCNTLNGIIESNVNSLVPDGNSVQLGSHRTQTLYNITNNTLGLRYKNNDTNYDYDGSPFGVYRYGTTRPNGVRVGFVFFDTSLSPARPIWYDGSNWVDATGTIV